MAHEDSQGFREPSRFATTSWSLLMRASRQDRAALEEIYQRYRRPVVLYLERKAPKALDPEMLADEVMLNVVDAGFLSELNRERGRFRDILLAMARHALNNSMRVARAKKRDYRKTVSLHDLKAEPPASDEERRGFAHLYAQEVFGAARERLEADAVQRRSPEVEVLRRFYERGETRLEIAAALDLPESTINNHIQRARARLRKHIEAVLGPVSATEEELQDEVTYLLRILGDKRPTSPA